VCIDNSLLTALKGLTRILATKGQKVTAAEAADQIVKIVQVNKDTFVRTTSVQTGSVPLLFSWNHDF
jgi:hypothetical protein